MSTNGYLLVPLRLSLMDEFSILSHDSKHYGMRKYILYCFDQNNAFKALENQTYFKTRFAKSVCLIGVYVRSYPHGPLLFYCLGAFLYAGRGRTTRCKRLAYRDKPCKLCIYTYVSLDKYVIVRLDVFMLY